VMKAKRARKMVLESWLSTYLSRMVNSPYPSPTS
jgi:hypothetical protein